MTVFDDDYDPLAPPAVEDEAAVEQPEDDPLAAPSFDDALPENQEEEHDGGFSDSDKVVRIWIEDGRLAKVRLSPVWFHKVPDAAALESRFRQAFILAGLRIAEVEPEPEQLALSEEDRERLRGLPELSRRSLVMFDAVGRDMDERHAAAREAQGPSSAPEPASGTSKGVTITLDETGMPAHVRFDPKWLDEAQVGSICTHVMVAADNAYGRYRPPEPDALAAELAAERRLYRTALLTMFTPRDRRRDG